MQFHRQLNRHIPALGQIGDCFRTCIACFLNLHPSDVPNFLELEFENGIPDSSNASPRMVAAYQAWLADRGLTLVDIPYQTENLQEILDLNLALNGSNFTYMMSGKSISANHVCIYRGNALLWDPAGGGGLIGPIDGIYWMSILASLRCRVEL